MSEQPVATGLPSRLVALGLALLVVAGAPCQTPSDVHVWRDQYGVPHIEADNEAELLSSLRVGVDGLILREGALQALFLPSVWQKLPDPCEFVEHLKIKAGLSKTFWSSTIVCERFTVEEIGGAVADYLGER